MKYTKNNRNRFNRAAGKSNDMKVVYFKSGGYCFPTVALNGKHYIRLANVAKYLQINTESLRNIAKHKHGYATASKKDLKQIASKFLFDRHSVHISLINAKSLYQLLKSIVTKHVYMKGNPTRLAKLINDLYEAYKNEIKGLTDLQANLAKHNARVEALNTKAIEANKLAGGDLDINEIDAKIKSNLAKIEKLKKTNSIMNEVREAQSKLKNAFQTAADNGVVLE